MTPESDTPTDESLADLPPSAKLVYKVLDYAGEPLDQPAIEAESLLPNRTVRYALRRLEAAGYVEEQPVVGDARRNEYDIADG